MSDPNRPIRPGDTVGILGGGQLGRMLALACAPLGLKAHVYCPDADSPAFDVAAARTVAAYDDAEALTRFASACHVVTYEFENVPGGSAEIVAAILPLHPNARALATAQDRLVEKRFVSDLGIATAPFRAVGSEADLVDALAAIGAPAILKTRRFGYDGKGQIRIEGGDRPGEAWAHFGGAPAILEGFVPFACEVSVVAARTASGEFAAYDLCLNRHRAGILDVTTAPANLAAPAMSGPPGTPAVPIEHAAMEAARRIADALDYVGVLAVELFVLEGADGPEIVVNEIAPRVHNTGHWTIEGAETSQFEQHVRAICGWPLGSPARRGSSVEMRNLIGDEIDAWPAILREPGVHLHHYGKTRPRPGRKMGHVTTIRP